jgi:hypothetical protein
MMPSVGTLSGSNRKAPPTSSNRTTSRRIMGPETLEKTVLRQEVVAPASVAASRH